jgi:hypothetical protein
MLKLAISSIALTLASPGFAGESCYQIGNSYHCYGTGDDMGYTSNSYRIGNGVILQENDVRSGDMRQTHCGYIGDNLNCY